MYFKQLVDHTCPVCSKNFIPAGLHSYKQDHEPYSLVCSYSCELKDEREYEAERKQKVLQRRKKEN